MATDNFVSIWSKEYNNNDNDSYLEMDTGDC